MPFYYEGTCYIAHVISLFKIYFLYFVEHNHKIIPVDSLIAVWRLPGLPWECESVGIPTDSHMGWEWE